MVHLLTLLLITLTVNWIEAVKFREYHLKWFNQLFFFSRTYFIRLIKDVGNETKTKKNYILFI